MPETLDNDRLSFRLAVRPFLHAFRFNGRSTRMEVASFWLLGILCSLFHLVVNVPSAMSTRILALLWSLLWNWPWVPLLVRRLHDQARSGWWACLLLLFPALFAVAWVSAPSGPGYSISLDLGVLRLTRQVGWNAGTIAGAVIAALLMIAIFILYLAPGTAGANRYGPALYD